jgi:hypothetical protein
LILDLTEFPRKSRDFREWIYFHRSIIWCLLIWVLCSFSLRGYIWQVSQLVAEHELQEELPPIGVDGPSLLLEKEAKEENIRLAPL